MPYGEASPVSIRSLSGWKWTRMELDKMASLALVSVDCYTISRVYFSVVGHKVVDMLGRNLL